MSFTAGLTAPRHFPFTAGRTSADSRGLLSEQVTVVRGDGSGGTDPRFDTPTALARFGDRFYQPNARFTVPSPMNAEHTVVSIPAHSQQVPT
ncbi:hypothetical protein [Streptomyces cellulosae]|uniref:Uncharacterized protein n=1 Tax=Streptomyces cellulosae TaxID=1968 RepID=A0ABW7YJ92_STRCE